MFDVIKTSRYFQLSLGLNVLMLFMSLISVTLFNLFNTTVWLVFLWLGVGILILYFGSLVFSIIYLFTSKRNLKSRFIPLIGNIIVFVLFPLLQTVVVQHQDITDLRIDNYVETEIVMDENNNEEVEDVVPVTDEKLSEEYDEYIEDRVEQIFEDEGLSVKAETGTFDASENNEGLWALTVPFNSIDADIILYTDLETKPWMDNERFDRELTEFEAVEKASLVQTTFNWQQILDSTEYTQQYIDTLEQEYIPTIESDIVILTEFNEWAKNNLEIMLNQHGSSENIPDKYKMIYQYYTDLSTITDDLITFNNLNLLIKAETRVGIESEDIDLVVLGSNDEDRASLLLGWHNERFKELMDERDSIGEYLESLKNET